MQHISSTIYENPKTAQKFVLTETDWGHLCLYQSKGYGALQISSMNFKLLGTNKQTANNLGLREFVYDNKFPVYSNMYIAPWLDLSLRADFSSYMGRYVCLSNDVVDYEIDRRGLSIPKTDYIARSNLMKQIIAEWKADFENDVLPPMLSALWANLDSILDSSVEAERQRKIGLLDKRMAKMKKTNDELALKAKENGWI